MCVCVCVCVCRCVRGGRGPRAGPQRAGWSRGEDGSGGGAQRPGETRWREPEGDEQEAAEHVGGAAHQEHAPAEGTFTVPLLHTPLISLYTCCITIHMLHHYTHVTSLYTCCITIHMLYHYTSVLSLYTCCITIHLFYHYTCYTCWISPGDQWSMNLSLYHYSPTCYIVYHVYKYALYVISSVILPISVGPGGLVPGNSQSQ